LNLKRPRTRQLCLVVTDIPVEYDISNLLRAKYSASARSDV
jgi:hypothetical protein